MTVGGPLDWARLRGDMAELEKSSAEAAEGDAVLQEVHARLFRTPMRDGKKSRRRRLSWALALAASLAFGVALWARTRVAPPLSFQMGVEGSAGRVGAVLSTPPSETLPVHFSDGSTLTMRSDSRAYVTATNPDGATIVLENGSMNAAVVHRRAGRWKIAAGPFTVLVTGTKFDVGWNVAKQTFELDLHEGFVTVLGPSLQAGVGRHMSPGDSLRVAVGSSPPDDKKIDVEAPAPAVIDNAPGAPPPAPSRMEKPTAAAHPSWKQLALDARYAEALSAAEADGFATLCRRESSADLLLLADTAHFAGSTDRAVQAFRSVRARFAGAHEAAVAAFSLGRMAYDEKHDFREASDWFQTYLREEPGGTLAREASGRLIEAYRGAGNPTAARDAAKAYLAAYPSGPHALLARSIVNR